MADKPKCLHVFPSFGPGGTELRVANIINASSLRLRHAVMSLDGGFEASYRILPASGVEFLQPPSGRGTAAFPFALRRTLSAAAPDLLLTYNWGAIDAVLAATLGRLCPVVHNECGFSDDYDLKKWRRILLRRALLNRIYATVCTSSTMLRIVLKTFRIAESKVLFIRTGVDTERFRPGHNEELRRSLGIETGMLLFGFVGRLRPEKNLALMLRAFARADINGAKLAIFGGGPCENELRLLAAGLGIADRVIFVGHQVDVSGSLRALDVFLMSSHTEQTPNALLEAMSSGLPCVCTDVGDMANILVGDQRSLIVPEGDTNVYAQCLRRIATDKELRTRFGAANRARMTEFHGLNRMIGEYVALYERALERPRTRRRGE
jgi:glycosyltransferase involved in cell wall biosynthesis